MRFDTVTNDFVGSALTNKKIIIKGNGEPWRPVVHVDDVCKSFIMVSEENLKKVEGQIFNNGSDELNIKVKDLAYIVKNEIPVYEIISGATLAFAALLLIIPGFATDVIGFMLIVPFTRNLILGKFTNKINYKNKNRNKKDFIEGEFEDIEEDDDRKI